MLRKMANGYYVGWKRGFTLAVSLAFAEMFASAPWVVLGWMIPEGVFDPSNRVQFALGLVALFGLVPVMFYFSCRMFGIELTDWVGEDKLPDTASQS